MHHDEVDAAIRLAKAKWHVSVSVADVKEWEESTKIKWREWCEDAVDVGSAWRT